MTGEGRRITARQAAGGLIVALVVAAGFAIPELFSPSNITQVLRQVSVTGIIAIGVTFVVVVGRLDLSVGSLLSLCAIVTVSLHDKVSPGAAIAAGIGIGALAGCVNGYLVAVRRLNSLIATLAMLSVFQGISLLYSGGQNALIASPDGTWFATIGRGYVFGVPMPVAILIVLSIIMSVLLRKTLFGAQVFAVGGNQIAAVYSTISAKRVIFATYVVSGTMTGIAAVIFGSRVMAAQNDSGSGYELAVLAGIILGGTSLLGGSGGIFRSVFGIVVLGFIQNALLLLGLPYYFQWLITWVIIIGAVWLDVASVRGRVFA